MKINKAYLLPIGILIIVLFVGLSINLWVSKILFWDKTTLEYAEELPSSSISIESWQREPEVSHLQQMPVFLPTRRMPEEIVDLGEPAEAPVKTTPSLMGILRIDDVRKAMLVNQDDPTQVAWAEEGETVEGWRVRKILTESVELENNAGEAVEVIIRRNSQDPIEPRPLIPPRVVTNGIDTKEKGTVAVEQASSGTPDKDPRVMNIPPTGILPNNAPLPPSENPIQQEQPVK